MGRILITALAWLAVGSAAAGPAPSAQALQVRTASGIVEGVDESVIRAFRDRNVHVGRKFPSMPNWLRISIGKPEEMQAFVDGLREIVPAKQRAA